LRKQNKQIISKSLYLFQAKTKIKRGIKHSNNSICAVVFTIKNVMFHLFRTVKKLN